ncbi:MAG: hypothetical protein ACR2GR_03525 [Rhodothermales bacterium]
MTPRLALPLLLAVFVAGCAELPPQPPAVQALSNPAGPGGGRPNLFADADGEVYLTWTEPSGDSLDALRFATWEGEAWSAPRTIAEGADWFVNWADFPALAASERLTAHYLARSGSSPYAYDVRVTQSADGGATWQEAITPHRDGTTTEHGFVSLVPWTQGRTALVWLDGREMADGPHGDHAGAMTLRFAALDTDGRLTNEALLDTRTCDCCQTAAARTSGGLVVAYRDRSEGEIRDIAVTRLEDSTWTSPEILHRDGWQISGCPVNGPALDAQGERVAAAWFTAADNVPRVQVAFSEDEGGSFGEPVVVDEGAPLGRVDIVLLSGGSALVSWLEQAGEQAAIRLRTVDPDGTLGPIMTVAETSSARASGFPRMIRSGDEVFFAWTEAGEPSRLRTARAVF